MLIDMENAERGGFSGSSRTRLQVANLDRLAVNSRKNSNDAQDADGGAEVATKLTSLDVLLSMLQSHLGEIRDFGASVKFFSDPSGLIIQLPDVAICPAHKMMHSGQTCPMC